MGVGRSASGGEYNLSDPLGSFVDVVRRVVLQPAQFFAAMPRSGRILRWTNMLYLHREHRERRARGGADEALRMTSPFGV